MHLAYILTTPAGSGVIEDSCKYLVDKKQAKRLLSSQESLDAVLLRARATLAKDGIKVEYSSLSTYSRLDEAYGPVRRQDDKTVAAETVRPRAVQEFDPKLLILPGKAMKTRTCSTQSSC